MKKKYALKMMILIFLIVVCFTPITFAARSYVAYENEDSTTSEFVIPFTQIGQPNATTTEAEQIQTTKIVTKSESTVGEVKIIATTTTTTATNMADPSQNVPGSGVVHTTYSVTLPDGTVGNDVKLTITSPTGETATVTFPDTDTKISDGTFDITLPLDYLVSEECNMTLTYTDDEGNAQTMEIGTLDENGVDLKKDKSFIEQGIEYAIGKIASFIEEILVRIFLPVGDGVVFLVSKSVGEVVTTDALIFNQVTKLNINYWQNNDSTAVKGILHNVVNQWYHVFFKIAVIVYMMVLVVAGIQILLHSTAEKTAQYKEYLTSWVIGVAILCLFPYAMKYIVMLGEAAVAGVGNAVTATEPSTPALLSEDLLSAFKYFGKTEFVEQMGGESDNPSDTMMYVRAQAQESKKLILVLIYFILIGQMLVLLIMYYKRAFMIAFLITIFPLVAMTYAIDKMGDKKAQSFSIWFREFVVNVVVQLFHAIVYVVMVDASVKLFVDSGGQKWLIMLISVLFLFQGEKILRSIFNVKSKANTIADLATTAATYTAMTSMFKGSGKDSIASKQDNADKEAINERNASRATWRTGAVSAVNTVNEDGDSVRSPSPSTQGPENAGQYRGGKDPEGVNTNAFDASEALDKVSMDSMKHRFENGLASKAAKFGVKAAGGVVGATYGMSKGDADGKMTENMIKGGHFGTQVSKGIFTPATGAINMIERRHDGNKLAKQIKEGKLDKELNLDAIAADVVPPNVNPDEVANQHGEDIQKIYREAFAAAAKAGGKGGRAKAEVAYWNYMKNNTKK